MNERSLGTFHVLMNLIIFSSDRDMDLTMDMRLMYLADVTSLG
jgi:hypothetical protein